jgi:hypothetical protein
VIVAMSSAPTLTKTPGWKEIYGHDPLPLLNLGHVDLAQQQGADHHDRDNEGERYPRCAARQARRRSYFVAAEF